MQPKLKQTAPRLRRSTIGFSSPRTGLQPPRIRRIAPRLTRVAPRTPGPSLGYQINPYIDYSRTLTREGGIKIVFKDHDASFWQMIWHLVVWLGPTAIGWLVISHSSITGDVRRDICLALLGGTVGYFVGWPAGVFRSIEIRPDCMILDDRQVFWATHMQAGWPQLRPNPDGSLILAGIYGTRHIEYMSIRRGDPLDAAPEVLAIHLQDAMQRLWSQPH
jgi:hypothetical protein